MLTSHHPHNSAYCAKALTPASGEFRNLWKKPVATQPVPWLLSRTRGYSAGIAQASGDAVDGQRHRTLEIG